MQKNIRWLAGLLAVQIALAVGLSLRGTDLAPASADGALLSVKADMVDRLTLDGPDKTTVQLVKQDGQWRLPAAGDFPADAERVRQLLDKLVQLKAGVPVATTPGAQARFKVAADGYERRIVLGQGDKALATLFLGTAQGARQVLARVDGSDAIHALALAVYEIPLKSDDWLDKAIVSVKADEVTGLELGDLRLTRGVALPDAAAAVKPASAAPAPVWTASAGLADGEKLSTDAASALLSALAGLRIDSVLSREAQPGYGLEQPVLALTAVRKDGSRVEYRLGKQAVGEDYVLKVSTRPEYFRMPAWSVSTLIDAAKRDRLTGVATVAGAQPAASAAGS